MDTKQRGSKTNIFALSVTTTAKELAKENPKRTLLLVCNNGTATVDVLSKQTQASGEGIPVLKGETYINDTSTAAFWIIAASGTQDIRVEEDGD